jgi:succinoglycan biosynthesis protein ExoA
MSERLGVPRDPGDLAVVAPVAPDSAVSFVIPARDAAVLLPDCLMRVLPQLGAEDELIVAAADADTAAAVRALAADDGRVQVVGNPDGTTPAALNRAIEVARHPVVIRIDAQSRIPEDYRDRLVRHLAASVAVNVGGRQVALTGDGFRAAVAAAMNSPLGHGGAAYRGTGEAGGQHASTLTVRPVDTVYLGAYRREALQRAGGFDERFVTNQDAELNERLRRAGGTVLLDPALAVGYLPRASVAALARQFHSYGKGRRATARRHPGSLRARQLAAPILVAGLAAAAVVALVGIVLGAPPSALAPLGLAVGGYGSLLITGTLLAGPAARRRRLPVALALATMHLAWGAGFLLGPRRRI